MVKSNVDTGEDFETSRSWARRCPQCFNGITYIHQDDSFAMLIAQATARSFSVCILRSSYNDTSFNLILLSRICMPLGSLCQDHKHHWAGISRGSERVMQLSPFAGAPLGIRGTPSITSTIWRPPSLGSDWVMAILLLIFRVVSWFACPGVSFIDPNGHGQQKHFSVDQGGSAPTHHWWQS